MAVAGKLATPVAFTSFISFCNVAVADVKPLAVKTCPLTSRVYVAADVNAAAGRSTVVTCFW